jgi:hypothetical protein
MLTYFQDIVFKYSYKTFWERLCMVTSHMDYTYIDYKFRPNRIGLTGTELFFHFYFLRNNWFPFVRVGSAKLQILLFFPLTPQQLLATNFLSSFLAAFECLVLVCYFIFFKNYQPKPSPDSILRSIIFNLCKYHLTTLFRAIQMLLLYWTSNKLMFF